MLHDFFYLTNYAANISFLQLLTAKSTNTQVLNGMKRKAHEENLIRELHPWRKDHNPTEEAALGKELEQLLHQDITFAG
jgi:hypothetical protein